MPLHTPAASRRRINRLGVPAHIYLRLLSMSASTRTTIAWMMQILLGLAFIASGANKLRDLPGTVAMFSKLGLPAALVYIVAFGEVLGGIGLLLVLFWLRRPQPAGL
jgi:uncharacterized membrane protein YphA (DoxX/SURF4 family)